MNKIEVVNSKNYHNKTYVAAYNKVGSMVKLILTLFEKHYLGVAVYKTEVSIWRWLRA